MSTEDLAPLIDDAILEDMEKKIKYEDSDSEESNEPEECEEVGYWGTVFNLTTLGLGSGVLTMPLNFAAAGVANGILITTFCFILQYITVMWIIHAAERKKTYDMGDIIAFLPGGKVWYWILYVINFLNTICCFFGYVVAFGDGSNFFISYFSKMISPEDAWEVPIDTNYTSDAWKKHFTDSNLTELKDVQKDLYVAAYPLFAEDVKFTVEQSGSTVGYMIAGVKNNWLLIVFAAIILLGSFANKTMVAGFSMFAVIANGIIVMYVFVDFVAGIFDEKKIVQNNVPQWCILGLSPAAAAGNFGYMANFLMAACVHPCMPEMYQELKDRTPELFSSALILSYVGQTILFVSFSIFGFFRYGEAFESNSNILNSMEDEGLFGFFTALSQMLIALVVCCVYPLLLAPLVAPIKNPVFNMVAKIALLILSIAITFVTKDLGVINNYTGAMSMTFIIFFSPLIAGYLLEEWQTLPRRMGLVLLGVVGAVCMVICLMYPSPEIRFSEWKVNEEQLGGLGLLHPDDLKADPSKYKADTMPNTRASYQNKITNAARSVKMDLRPADMGNFQKLWDTFVPTTEYYVEKDLETMARFSNAFKDVRTSPDFTNKINEAMDKAQKEEEEKLKEKDVDVTTEENKKKIQTARDLARVKKMRNILEVKVQDLYNGYRKHSEPIDKCTYRFQGRDLTNPFEDPDLKK